MKARIYIALGLASFLVGLAALHPHAGLGPSTFVKQVSARSPRLSPPRQKDQGGAVYPSGEEDLDPSSSGPTNRSIDRVPDSVSDSEVPAVLEEIGRTRGAESTEPNLALIRRWAEKDP